MKSSASFFVAKHTISLKHKYILIYTTNPSFSNRYCENHANMLQLSKPVQSLEIKAFRAFEPLALHIHYRNEVIHDVS